MWKCLCRFYQRDFFLRKKNIWNRNCVLDLFGHTFKPKHIWRVNENSGSEYRKYSIKKSIKSRACIIDLSCDTFFLKGSGGEAGANVGGEGGDGGTSDGGSGGKHKNAHEAAKEY